jgi:hypothetical protein
MSAAVIALARKEVRALLPVWAATVGTIVADPLIRATSWHSLFPPLGPFAYIVGSLALGAHVMGHEYSNRTLGSLLAQPCRRSSILLTKTIVLAAMLLGFVLLAWPLVFAAPHRMFEDVSLPATLLLPAAGGLLVAPYVTMRTRSQIAGIVFTAAIPGITYTLTLLVGVILYGVRSNAAEALAGAVWPPAMVIAAGVGGFLSVRTFLRLQDIEGGREELSLPRWLAPADR